MHHLKEIICSFRFRILSSVIALLIPSIVFPSLLISQINQRELMERDEHQTVSALSIASSYIQSLLEEASGAAYVVQSMEPVDEYLLGTFSTVLAQTRAKRDFDEALKTVFRLYDYITDILFVKEDGTLVGSSLDWHYCFETNSHPLLQTETYQQYSKKNNPIWLGCYDANYLLQNLVSPGASSLYARSGYRLLCLNRLRYTYSGSAYDKDISVIIAIDEEALRNRFSHLSDGVSEVMLLDSKGTCLSCSSPAQMGTVVNFVAAIPQDEFGSFSYTGSDNNPFHIIYYRLNAPDWILVRKVPLAVYSASGDLLRHRTMIIGIVSLVLMSLLYGLWSLWICQPLKKMATALVKVSNGDWDTRLQENENMPSELRLMGHQMNEMLESLQDLIIRNEQTEQRKYQLEMRALQAQITPHFLFNTLASIRYMAMTTGATEVEKMMTCFVHLLHPVFSDWTMEWPLQEELNFAENYITLIRMRYQNQAAISVECPEELMMHAIPRFTLQPILENSCEHGMRDGVPLLVQVSISHQEDYLILCVTDNGCGMTQDVLEHLRANLLEEDAPKPGLNGSRSIGLFNIHKRLQLYYGEKSGLHIESIYGHGTTVRAHIGDTRLLSGH